MATRTTDPGSIAPTPVDSQMPTWSERMDEWLDHFAFWRLSVYHFIRALLLTIRTNPAGVFHLAELRNKAFAGCWQDARGPENPAEGPLGGFISLMGSATGVVLDIGPGDGRIVRFLTNPGVRSVYGAEPCVQLHGPLQQAVNRAGLTSKYKILACGGERASLVPGLASAGVLRDSKGGIFDVIVCSKVLCTLPNAEDTMDSLYDLLKPGGSFLFCEHVRNPWRSPKGSIIGRAVQVLLTMLAWPFFMSGCHLDRRTEQVVRQSAGKDGGWETVEVDRLAQWSSLPWVLGKAVKKT